MTWPELDDYTRAGRRSTVCGSVHRKDGSMIYNKAWAETSELTSGEIEHQAVRMLKPGAHQAGRVY